jgi:PKD repeat protein
MKRLKAPALAGLSLATALSAPVFPAGAQTPIYDGTNTNTWVYPAGEPVPQTWRIGGGGLTLAAGPDGSGGVSVLHESAAFISLPGVFESAFVLVNDALASHPGVVAPTPSVYVLGLTPARFSEASPAAPGHELTPPSGTTADQALTVKIQAFGVPSSLTEIYWRIDGPLNPVQGVTGRGDATFAIAGEGVHGLEYVVQVAGIYNTPVLTASYTITGPAGGGRLDSDGDGIPDFIEQAAGLDALTEDTFADTDGDGWSNLDELLRGTDPNGSANSPADTDGDGWSNWDEDVRGTDPANVESLPAAVRLYGVEERTTALVSEEWAGAVTSANPFAITGTDLQGRTLVRRATNGKLFASTPMAGNALSVFRISAAEPFFVRGQRQGVDAPAFGTVKVFRPHRDDVTPQTITAALPEGAPGLATVEDWRTAVRAALVTGLVVDASFTASLRTTALAALVESLVRWYHGVDAPLVVRGLEAEVGVAQTGADRLRVEAARLEGTPGTPNGHGLDALALRLDALMNVGAPLEGLAARATAEYATVPGAAAMDQAFDIRLARLLQEGQTAAVVIGAGETAYTLPGNALWPTARYHARLNAYYGGLVIAAFDPTEVTGLALPGNDADGDSLTNGAEFERAFEEATDPLNPDTDGDLADDGLDRCRTDARDECFFGEPNTRDTDGDGILDLVDNCVDVPNNEIVFVNGEPIETDLNGDSVIDRQNDWNADGRGDACVVGVFITNPKTHLRVRTGTTVAFQGAYAADVFGWEPWIDIRWSFDGLEADRFGLDPGSVVFHSPKAGGAPYAVCVEASSALLGLITTDCRTVEVYGLPTGRPTVSIDAVATVEEGNSVTFTAVASSPNGAITDYLWQFADGESGPGAGVVKVYLTQQTDTVTLTVSDALGVTNSATHTVTVTDSAPTAAFSVETTELDAAFSDLSTGYDGIVAWSWDFGFPGGTSVEMSPEVTFPAGGTYDVTLTVVDDDGSVGSVTRAVTVSDPVPTPSGCRFVGTTLFVDIGRFNEATVRRLVGTTQIQVIDGDGALLPCGGAPTTSTVDRIAAAGVDGTETFRLDLSGGTFAPGKTSEGAGNTSEIEIDVDLGTGTGDLFEIVGSAGTDRYTVLADFTVKLNTDADADVTMTGVDELTILGGNGSDTLQMDALTGAAGGPTVVTLDGQAGNDTLIDGPGDETLLGGPGNDIIRPRGGLNTIDAGTETDTLDGSLAPAGIIANLTTRTLGGAASGTIDGFERLTGSPFDDELTGDANVNLILGGDGQDRLDGAGGNDTLQGGAARDWLYGGDGNDTLKGEAGSDFLYGGAGNDNLQGGDDHDRLYGEDGTDTLIGGTGENTLDGGAGIDTATYATATSPVFVDLAAGTVSGYASESITGVERVTGSPFDDEIRGDAQANLLKGEGGDDLLEGGDLNDTLYGGIGHDTLRGGAGNDSLRGEDGDDTLEGQDGNDTLIGGTGVNTLVGGVGTDTADYQAATSGVSVDLTAGTTVGFATDALSTIENVNGSPHADTLRGDALNNRLDGKAGADTLIGEGGNDTLIGGLDVDVISGGLGTDTCTDAADARDTCER